MRGAAPGGADAQLAQLQGLQRAQQCFFAAFAAAAAEMAEEWGAPPPLGKPAAGPSASGAPASTSPARAPSPLEGSLAREREEGLEEVEARLPQPILDGLLRLSRFFFLLPHGLHLLRRNWAGALGAIS